MSSIKILNWDNKKLEPVIITYNRAESLAATLAAFYNAGLSSMRLHVLDNASTDNTKQIVEEYSDKWPLLIYHKNKYNIGGNANILRAVEFSSSEYSWVIGDDDEWYLENISELISILNNGDSDIIRLGWLVTNNSRGRSITLKELFNEEQTLFASLSMISSTITRRSLIVKYLQYSYTNIANSFPQLVPYIMSLNSENMTVCSVSKDIMKHTPGKAGDQGYFLGDLEFFSHWFYTSRFLNNKYRKKFNDEILYYATKENKLLAHFIYFLKIIWYFKVAGLDQSAYIYLMFLTGNGHRLFLGALLILYYLMPKKLYSIIYNFRQYYNGNNICPIRPISRNIKRL